MRKAWLHLDLDESVSIIAHWGIRPTGFEAVRSVYRVTCNGGTLALKPSGRDEDHVRLVAEVFEYLATRGFTRTAPFIPTLNDEAFLRWGEDLLVLTPWREGREPDYRKPGDIARCVPVLAEFHVAGLGFSPIEAAISNKIGRWPRKLHRKTNDLKVLLERARGSDRPDEFDKLFLEVGPRLVRQAELACDNLSRTAYARRCEWGKQVLPLCHGDTAERNFVIGDDGKEYLIDLDSVETDLPEADLWRLLRRTLRNVEWDVEVAREILAAYAAVAPLGGAEKGVILALLQFPDKGFKLAKRYYAKKGDDEGPYSPQRYARQLTVLRADLPRRERFLANFARVYEVAGLRVDGAGV